MSELPSGTVTFLFTDIEGSTRLLQSAGDSYPMLLDTHRSIIREAISSGGGHELGTEGDSFAIAFEKASDGVAAAFEAQRGLCLHDWPGGHQVHVRMGLHTGEAGVFSGGYVGLAIHQAARVSSASHGRQILLSSTTADIVRDTLPPAVGLRDLGAHRLKDIDRPQQLFQLVHPDLPNDFPPTTSFASLPTNLPSQLTSFVGRENDLAEAGRLLSRTRLLTLTGAGGSGKTRLAVELATEVARSYPDGAWLVDFAPVAEPALVAQATAFALGLREESSPRSWEDRVTEFLRDKTMLLVLDNCEHLVGACADLAHALLHSCPGLRVIATTREPLDVDGETAWRVPSLALPPDGADAEQSAASGAVKLFVERARDANPSFLFDDRNAGHVVEICRHLDGIPLAIELAAARTQVLAPQQIVARLDDRFRLLRGSGRRRIERQQTLRATVDWSHELLVDAERVLLRRLSVFSGGFTLDAVEAVCASDQIEPHDVLDLVSSLLRKSLVVAEDHAGGVRYRLLETIRQYALEKLLDSGEGQTYRTRHRDHFLGLAREAGRELHRELAVEPIERLEADLDNLRSALEWTPPGDDGQAGLELATAFAWIAFMRGFVPEGRTRLRAALDRDAGPPTAARAEALAVAGTLAFHQGDIVAEAATVDEALAILDRLDDTADNARTRANVLVDWAMVAWFRDSDIDRAEELLNESQAIGASRSDRFAEGLAVYNLAAVRAHRGDHQGAVALLERAEAIGPGSAWTAALHSAMALQLLALGHGDRARTVAEEAVESARASKIDLNIMRALAALGSAAIVQGDLGLARAASAEQIALGRSFGERLQGIGWGLALQATAQAVAEDYEGAERSFEAALVEFEAASSLPAVAEATLSMAQLREALSDLDAAEVAYRRALDIRRQIGGRHALADCLEGLAAIAASRGDYAEASHLLGEAEQTRREAGPRGWELWTGPPLPAREVWFARMREALASGV